ncbi:MAG: type II toxin-antitoxin system RelE/ParE family toxin [Burkholderiaceae bacterium]|nr:type II toxin-antitoxin system RelE/ParE family toxin [Burkholderiaceae bacterium]
MIYELHPDAETELNNAALHYAKEASKAIALAFLAEFERVAELLESNQQLGTKSKGGLRVYPFRRFPYSIVYREVASGPYLYAVAHQRQEPGYWLGRV